MMFTSLSKYHFTEIFVVRYQYPVFCQCLCQNIVVWQPLNGKDFVIFATEPLGDRGAGAFVHQKTHFTRSPKLAA